MLSRFFVAPFGLPFETEISVHPSKNLLFVATVACPNADQQFREFIGQLKWDSRSPRRVQKKITQENHLFLSTGTALERT